MTFRRYPVVKLWPVMPVRKGKARITIMLDDARFVPIAAGSEEATVLTNAWLQSDGHGDHYDL